MRMLVVGAIILLAIGATAGQGLITKEEYRIYALVLTDFFRGQKREEGDYAEKHHLIASKTGHRRTLERRLPVAFSYSIVDEQEIRRWAAQDFDEYQSKQEQRRKEGKPLDGNTCGPGWPRFYAYYPASGGFYRLSRIRFSRNHRRARIEILGEGGTWSTNVTYWVTWTRRGWKVGPSSGGSSVC